MRLPSYSQETEILLRQDRILTVEDFAAACPGLTRTAVYSRIRSLILAGRMSVVGRGRYRSVRKLQYKVDISPWMQEIHQFLQDRCPGVPVCLSQKGGNLLVEVSKCDMDSVLSRLREKEEKVVLERDAKRFPGPLDGYILVGRLISDAPVEMQASCLVSTPEKELVDALCGKGSATAFNDTQRMFQRYFDIYPIHRNRLNRYAARRGVSDNLSKMLSGLDQSRMDLFLQIQRFLSGTPVTRAWVFGSFARGEETPKSDVDLLVDYDKTVRISLLDIIRYKLDLENLIGRTVDWVEEGTLKPFAAPSAHRDKYLIYERQI